MPSETTDFASSCLMCLLSAYSGGCPFVRRLHRFQLNAFRLQTAGVSYHVNRLLLSTMRPAQLILCIFSSSRLHLFKIAHSSSKLPFQSFSRLTLFFNFKRAFSTNFRPLAEWIYVGIGPSSSKRPIFLSISRQAKSTLNLIWINPLLITQIPRSSRTLHRRWDDLNECA